MFHLVDANLQETTCSLGQLLSRTPYTLLYFYPKDDTPGCTLEAQQFSTVTNQLTEYGVQIVGVSKDTISSHCKFITKHKLQPSYLSDPELLLHKQYGARGEKNNYGKIVTGVIRSTFLLDTTGKLIHERRNVRATGHAPRVAERIATYLSPTSPS